MSGWLDGTPLAAIPGAVAGGLVAGALLPLLGMWVVLQRVVFLGVTLAQIAAAGVALGLALDMAPLPFGLGLTLLVVALAAGRGRGRVVTTLGDAALGATFCAASALSLLFISRSPADMDAVQHVLHGNLIYAAPVDVAWVAGTLLAGAVVLGLFFKELLFATFDPETASALGLRARRWVLLLFVVLAASLSVSMRTTGSLLSFAMLVLPPLAALQLRCGLRASFVLASVLGVLGTLAGLLLAVASDLHLESSITITLFALLPVCAAWKRQPVLALALVGGLVGAGWWLRIEPEDASRHAHHHEAPHAEDAVVDEPLHLDVQLVARQDVAGELTVDWTLVAHRGPTETGLPPALYLLLTADDFFHEHSLLPKTEELPVGDSRHAGTFVLEHPVPLHRLEGQLWTGPSDSLDALPLDPAHAVVEGTDVERVLTRD